MRHRLWLLPIAVLLAFAVPPPVTVAVNPRIAIGTRDVRVTATIEPSRDNRLLVIAIDGTAYMRQDVELNTDPSLDDAKTQVRWFKRVPPGRYAVSAVLVRTQNKSFRAASEFCLVGMAEDCQGETR